VRTRQAKSIIREVEETAKDFTAFADEAGIEEEKAAKIQSGFRWFTG